MMCLSLFPLDLESLLFYALLPYAFDEVFGEYIAVLSFINQYY